MIERVGANDRCDQGVPFVHHCQRFLPRAVQENGIHKEDGGRCSQQQEIGDLESVGPVQPNSSATEEPGKKEDRRDRSN